MASIKELSRITPNMPVVCLKKGTELRTSTFEDGNTYGLKHDTYFGISNTQSFLNVGQVTLHPVEVEPGNADTVYKYYSSDYGSVYKLGEFASKFSNSISHVLRAEAIRELEDVLNGRPSIKNCIVVRPDRDTMLFTASRSSKVSASLISDDGCVYIPPSRFNQPYLESRGLLACYPSSKSHRMIDRAFFDVTGADWMSNALDTIETVSDPKSSHTIVNSLSIQDQISLAMENVLHSKIVQYPSVLRGFPD